jgi:hypothetical protein
MPDYTRMTLAQLQSEFIQLGQQLTTIQNNRMEIFSLIQQRQAEAKARIRISTLDSIEKDALRSVLSEP